MEVSDAVTIGLLAVPVAALVGRALVYLCRDLQERREIAAANSPEDRHGIILERMARRYAHEGHAKPWQAASDEIGGSIEVARFRAAAQEDYVRTGRSLDDIRKEWWRAAAKRILATASVGRSKAEATAYLKAVEAVIYGETEDTVYVDGAAAEKWQAEKKRITEWNAAHERQRSRDAITDKVLDGYWENLLGGRL